MKFRFNKSDHMNYIDRLKDITSDIESTNRDIRIAKLIGDLPSWIEKTPNDLFINDVREYISTIENKDDIPNIFLSTDIFLDIPQLEGGIKIYGSDFISGIRMIWSEWRFKESFNARDILMSDIVDDFETKRKDF